MCLWALQWALIWTRGFDLVMGSGWGGGYISQGWGDAPVLSEGANTIPGTGEFSDNAQGTGNTP